MYKIGIIGLGLMGGSLAKAFSNLNEVREIIGFDTNLQFMKDAKTDGYITDFSNDIDEKFSDLNFVFICTPVNTIYEYAIKLKEVVSSNCIITDIGSTKKEIVNKIDELGLNFVGGHPMIGSEKFGYNFSSDSLYKNAFYLLTKTNKTKEENIEALKELLLKLEAKPLEIDLGKHDFSVGAVSHIPHIIASGLVNLIEDLDDSNQNMKKIAAGGFKDITRIASANPYMWQNICSQNKDEIIKILDKFEIMIKNFKDNINNEQFLFNYFEKAKNYRDSFFIKEFFVKIEAKNEIRFLSNITSICSDNHINIKNIKLLKPEYDGEDVVYLFFDNEEEYRKCVKLFKNSEYKIKENSMDI